MRQYFLLIALLALLLPVGAVALSQHLHAQEPNLSYLPLTRAFPPSRLTLVSAVEEPSQFEPFGANGQSLFPTISADGRYVAFTSDASNLIPNDSNNVRDIFVYERETATITRVSVASDGTEANAESQYGVALSGDGRFVLFASNASNLVPNDTNEYTDLFVHDRQIGETTRVSVASDGHQGNWNVGPMQACCEDSWSLSSDGRYVGFVSGASNLVPEDNNGVADIFLHDRETGETTRLAEGGISRFVFPTIAISLSGDGRYAAFTSWMSNLVPEDSNNQPDVFVLDRQSGGISRVSVGTEGSQAESSYALVISHDGRFVAFNAWGSLGTGCSLGGTFVHDRESGTTTCVSVASDGTPANLGFDTGGVAISGDGRFVSFVSRSTNLAYPPVPYPPEVFVHDRETGETFRVAVAMDGGPGNFPSWSSQSISADGRFVVFGSFASNLVPDDSNRVQDIFLYDRNLVTTP